MKDDDQQEAPQEKDDWSAYRKVGAKTDQQREELEEEQARQQRLRESEGK